MCHNHRIKKQPPTKLLWLLAAAVLLCACTILAPCVMAEESEGTLQLVAQDSQAVPGKKLRVTVSFGEDCPLPLSAFRLNLSYNGKCLTLTDVEAGASLAQGDFAYYATEQGGTVVYASTTNSVANAKTPCCTLVFTVEKTAPSGSTTLQVTADQLVNTSLEKQPGAKGSLSFAVAKANTTTQKKSATTTKSETQEPTANTEQTGELVQATESQTATNNRIIIYQTNEFPMFLIGLAFGVVSILLLVAVALLLVQQKRYKTKQ